MGMKLTRFQARKTIRDACTQQRKLKRANRGRKKRVERNFDSKHFSFNTGLVTCNHLKRRVFILLVILTALAETIQIAKPNRIKQFTTIIRAMCIGSFLAASSDGGAALLDAATNGTRLNGKDVGQGGKPAAGESAANNIKGIKNREGRCGEFQPVCFRSVQKELSQRAETFVSRSRHSVFKATRIIHPETAVLRRERFVRVASHRGDTW